MCKIMEDLNQKAVKEARKDEKMKNAVALIRIGKLSFEEIALCVGLTVDEVKTLAEGETA